MCVCVCVCVLNLLVFTLQSCTHFPPGNTGVSLCLISFSTDLLSVMSFHICTTSSEPRSQTGVQFVTFLNLSSNCSATRGLLPCNNTSTTITLPLQSHFYYEDTRSSPLTYHTVIALMCSTDVCSHQN